MLNVCFDMGHACSLTVDGSELQAKVTMKP